MLPTHLRMEGLLSSQASLEQGSVISWLGNNFEILMQAVIGDIYDFLVFLERKQELEIPYV